MCSVIQPGKKTVTHRSQHSVTHQAKIAVTLLESFTVIRGA